MTLIGSPRSRSAIFGVTPFDGKCQNLQMPSHLFALAITVSEIEKCQIFLPEKVGQSHGVQFCHLNRLIEQQEQLGD